jgi:hypothetical protein
MRIVSVPKKSPSADSTTGACILQGSQARRRVKIHGPKARNIGNCGRVFDQLIEISKPKRGVFRPILPPKCTCPPQEAPWGTAGRKWPRPFHQLVEISKGSLRVWYPASPACICFTVLATVSTTVHSKQRTTHVAVQKPPLGSVTALCH